MAAAVCCVANVAQAAISVPVGGSETFGFDSRPAATEWATGAFSGGGGDITTEDAMDTRVQTLVASTLTAQVAENAAYGTHGSGFYRNTTTQLLFSDPSGIAAMSLMATLQNDTGADQSALQISYDLSLGSYTTEELPGHRVYYSLTGQANSWVKIPELSVGTAGGLNVVVTLASAWAAGSQMYILWVDDNGNGQTDGWFGIDNVRFTTDTAPPPLSIELVTPTDGQEYVGSPLGNTVTVTTKITGKPVKAEYYLDGVAFATLTAAPFTSAVTPPLLADSYYDVSASAWDIDGNQVDSSTRTIHITAVPPPIMVPAEGAGPFAFDTVPVGTQWIPVIFGGAAADLTTLDAFETRIQTYDANTNLFGELPTNAAEPPTNIGGGGFASARGALYTRPTGTAIGAFMSVLQNNTGADAWTLTVSYNYTSEVAVTEEIPGQQVYFSLTGLPNSWVRISELSGIDTSGALTGTASFSSPWAHGAKMFVLWADDNGSGAPDILHTVDNVSFAAGATPPPLAISLLSPTNGQTYAACSVAHVNAKITGIATKVTYFLDGSPFAERTAVPFTPVTTGVLSPGYHEINATAEDSGGNTVTTEYIGINVSELPPVQIEITNTYSGTVTGFVYEVGTCVYNQLLVSDTTMAVEFLVDGNVHAHIPGGSGNMANVLVNSSTVGTHTYSVRAIDGCGTVHNCTSNVVVTITAPPAPNVMIVANQSVWKYSSTGSEPSTNAGLRWFQKAYNDATWASGPAELGAGDFRPTSTDPVNPEATVIDIGATTRYNASYFRHAFTVTDPTKYSALIVKLLCDDGGVVYLNGTEIYRTNMMEGEITYTNWTLNAAAMADDGTIFHSTTNGIAQLVAGNNVLAVEIHNNNATSSDLSFDLMLWGVAGPVTGPTLHVTRNEANGKVVITWAGSGFKLQQTTQVLPVGTAWVDVAGNPQNSYEVTPTGTALFFRLVQ